MMTATRQWGVTPPVSMTFPTETDIAINDALVEELKSQNNFEKPEETQKRYDARRDERWEEDHRLTMWLTERLCSSQFRRSRRNLYTK